MGIQGSGFPDSRPDSRIHGFPEIPGFPARLNDFDIRNLPKQNLQTTKDRNRPETGRNRQKCFFEGFEFSGNRFLLSLSVSLRLLPKQNLQSVPLCLLLSRESGNLGIRGSGNPARNLGIRPGIQESGTLGSWESIAEVAKVQH